MCGDTVSLLEGPVYQCLSSVKTFPLIILQASLAGQNSVDVEIWVFSQAHVLVALSVMSCYREAVDLQRCTLKVGQKKDNMYS